MQQGDHRRGWRIKQALGGAPLMGILSQYVQANSGYGSTPGPSVLMRQLQLVEGLQHWG